MATLTLTFAHDLKNTDGSAFDGTQFAGVEYSVDGAPFVSVPASFAIDGNFAVDVPSVSFGIGEHSATVAVRHIDGTTSEASDPGFFTVLARVPTKPVGLSVSYSP